MSAYQPLPAGPYVMAVCISRGGIPKRPQNVACALIDGLVDDGRNHAKHIRPDRAISLWDYEILRQLVAEGFSLAPGTAGENLTVVGLHVQELPPGTILKMGDVLLKLEQPRRPCYVLDTIDPRLKEAIVGRCGYMASVLHAGTIRPGMRIEIISTSELDEPNEPWSQSNEITARPGAMAYHMLAGPAVG